MSAPAPLLTTDELADYLRVPISTIYAWNHRGSGPKRMRVGKRVLYRLSDVEAWLVEQEEE